MGQPWNRCPLKSSRLTGSEEFDADCGVARLTIPSLVSLFGATQQNHVPSRALIQQYPLLAQSGLFEWLAVRPSPAAASSAEQLNIANPICQLLTHS